MGIGACRRIVDAVLAAHLAEFRFDAHAVLVRKSRNFSGGFTVLCIGELRTVVHDRGESQLDGLAAEVGVFCVVQVH